MTPITPERIPLLALPWLTFAQRQDLPEEACVYFVLDGSGRMLYIGHTVNLQQRFLGHHRREQFRLHGECRIAWLTVSDPTLLEAIETACIHYFQPAWNQTKTLYKDAWKASTSIRLTAEARRLLQQLALKFGLSQAAILELVIRDKAKQEGLHA